MEPLPDSMKCTITTQKDINDFFKIDDETSKRIRMDAKSVPPVFFDPAHDNHRIGEYFATKLANPDCEFYNLRNANKLKDASFTVLLPLMSRISPRARDELFCILGQKEVSDLMDLLPCFAFTKVHKKACKLPVPPQSNQSDEEYANLRKKLKMREENEFKRAKLEAAKRDAPIKELLRREMRIFTRKYIN